METGKDTYALQTRSWSEQLHLGYQIKYDIILADAAGIKYITFSHYIASAQRTMENVKDAYIFRQTLLKSILRVFKRYEKLRKIENSLKFQSIKLWGKVVRNRET